MQVIIKTLMLPFTFLFMIVGKIKWTMPPWLTYLNELRKRSLLKLLLLLALIFLFIFGAYKAFEYYKNMPEPQLITTQVELPLTLDVFDPYDMQESARENGLGSAADSDEKPLQPALAIQFNYNKASSDGAQPSVAPIELLGAIVKSGIKMSPVKEGDWVWANDRSLVFTPTSPWPPGQEYTVSFAPEVFSTTDEFASYELNFTTTPLKAKVYQAKFELDPATNQKRVSVEYDFNYAIDKASFEQSISMAFLKEEGATDIQTQAISNFTTEVNDGGFFATVMLQLDALPTERSIVQTTLKQGLRAQRGGQAMAQNLDAKVTVPDVYSYLKVEDFRVDILRSPENEPEQFVLLRFTDPISKPELLDKLKMYRLPVNGQPNGKAYWQNPREVSAKVLNSAQPIDFVVMPNKNENSTTYQLKIDEPQGKQYYFKLDAGLRSANGFIYKSFYDRIFAAPKYPQEIVINGEGSLMTYSKDQRLAFTTRGLNAVKVSIGKVIDDELYHLVSQTRGDISNPNFTNWSFGPENLASFSTRTMNMSAGEMDPKTANYGSVDLNGLVSNTNNELGLFFIELTGWDRKTNRQVYGVSDKLLLLVTDLGVIVKTSADQSQDIFVQSISSGKPAANVKVELLGKNGKPLYSKVTDARGHVSMPSADSFTREQQPTVFVATTNRDVSFIPYDRYSRQINYSRFDVSGRYDYRSDDNAGVTGFVFSDRGIYRPGESVDLAGIVKNAGFKELQNIPLELVIRDSQYNEIKVHKFQLPQLGMFEYRFDTKPDFVTGDYTAVLHLVRTENQGRDGQGGYYTRQYRSRQIGQTSFSVEAFQPDTMAISNEVDTLAETKGWLTGLSLSNTVRLTNLFGSPAQRRDVSSDMYLRPTSFTFDEYEGFRFNSLGSRADSDIDSLDLPLKEAQTDENGESTFVFNLATTPIGELKAGAFFVNNSVEGYEASGGRSVNTSSSFRYSPLAFMLGYKADGDLTFLKKEAQRKLALVAIDNQLQTIALENIEKRLSLVTTVSTLVETYSGRFQYESIEQKKLINSEQISVQAALSTSQEDNQSPYQELSLDTNTAGTYLLEFFDPQGRLLSAMSYTVVGESNDTGKLEKDAELALKLNKTDFAAGEEIEVSIQAPYEGSGLITIESNKLHTFTWFSANTKNSIQRIKIPDDLEGNAYVNVAFVRDVSSPEILTSPLSYAVQPFSIDRSKRRVKMDISTVDIAEPGKPLDINLELDQDAKLLVFAVDLGILNVADYETPDPLSYFLQKRALGVRTMQILDLILPDFVLSKMLSAAGGDAEMKASDAFAEKIMVTGSRIMRTDNPFSRQVKEPVVYWSGIIDAKKGQNRVTYQVPDDFAGGLRVMAVAAGKGTVGNAQESLLVRGPFVLSPSILNQSAPGDEFDVTLSIANLVENEDRATTAAAAKNNLSIKVNTSAHLSFVEEANNEQAQVVGDTLSMQMQLAPNQEDAVRFRVKANNLLGAASVNFDVSMTDANGKKYQATRSVSTSVRPASPYMVNIVTGVAQDGQINIDSPKPFFEQFSAYSLRASSSPLVIADGLSDYLAEYPHGCTEQMVSQVFPLIGLSNLNIYQGTEKGKQALEHFNEVIKKLRARQSYSGGFAYWPNRQDNDFEVSIYVAHFLIEAQALGYPVPSDMLQSAVAYIDNTLSAMSSQQKSTQNTPENTLSLRNRAHAIYLLTRRGVVTSNLIIDFLSNVNALYQAQPELWKEDLMSSYIAASYRLMQRTDDANELISAYRVNSKASQLQAISGDSSVLALNAQYLYLVSKHFPTRLKEMSKELVLSVTSDIHAGRYNTISASYSTLALGAYHAASADLSGTDLNIEFESFQQNTAKQLRPTYSPFPTVSYKESAMQVDRVTAKSDSDALFYVDLQAGFATEAPNEALKQGIEIQRSFVNEKGEVITSMKQGEKAIVRLRVRSTDKANIENVAIVDLLPGGFEVLRESVNRSNGPLRPEHIDIRDDRVVFYGSVGKSIKEIKYTVQATAAGEFTIPPSLAESMYDRNIKGQSLAGKFVVYAD